MTRELKADLSLLLITIIWGVTFPITSVILKYVPPYSLIALRYLLAGLILAAIFYKRLKTMNKETLKAGLLIGTSIFVGTALQVIGMLYTTPSKSGFITGLNVVIVPLVLALLYKKIPDLKTIIGVILSVIGLGVISINGDLTINFGDFLTILGAVAFAAQIILVDKCVKDADIIALTCIQTLIVGILALIPAGAIEKLDIVFNYGSVASIVFMAIFCTIIAYLVQNKMQPYTSPTHAAIIFLAEPVFSAIFSTFIGDRLTGKTLTGCGLILLGMIVINIKTNNGVKAVEIETNV
ncbi:DMT family transporter [Clostridium sp. A1-XYC3]|uniref:DMT family transporter n=1 Tax=Clostridium tanneri TaxID=3037988 RepID=A0ABU4JR28_9CLOT|nr:DMT family transporter [Clostridium sp. A1-XYC3]MDW8800612.1 DMT family transporter [Clostridium sp. A1-XYC3]